MPDSTWPPGFTNVYAPGMQINDHTFLRAGNEWHLFHIWIDGGGPRDKVIGHAVSNDLLEWKQQADILPKEPAPSWEDCPGANAPFVLECGGIYHLFYSRYHIAPHGRYELQQIGLAKSTDLYNWVKYEKNPVFHPEAYWCPWEDRISNLFRPGCCRDPHVMRYHDKWIMYYVANTRTDRICAVAYAVSDDLVRWSDKGPVLTMPVTNTGTEMCESPCVVQHDHRWFLFFKHGLATHCAESDTPFHFAQPASLSPCHASEVFEWRGRWYISHCGVEGLGLARLDFSGKQPKVTPLGSVTGTLPEKR